MINWQLIRNPINWVTITLMLAFALIGVHLVVNHYQAKSAPQ